MVLTAGGTEDVTEYCTCGQEAPFSTRNSPVTSRGTNTVLTDTVLHHMSDFKVCVQGDQQTQQLILNVWWDYNLYGIIVPLTYIVKYIIDYPTKTSREAVLHAD